MANERGSRPAEAPGLRRLADDLLAQVMEGVGGVSGTFWMIGPGQALHPLATRGKPSSRKIDPGDILRHHEEILQGTPFFENDSGKVVFDAFFLPILHLGNLLGLVHIELPPSAGKAAAESIARMRQIAEEHSPLLASAQAVERLRSDPLRDPDSDAYHEAFLLDFLQREILRARRYRRRLGLIALEVEGVQGFQRKHGFRMAQGLLRDLTEALRGLLREHDVVAHAGEFRVLVALPDTDRLGCRVVAARLRKGLRQLDFLRERFERYQLSPHLGFACYPEDGKDRDALLMSALGSAAVARRDPFLGRDWKARPFWTTLEGIMKSPGREQVERSSGTAHGLFPTSFLYLLQEAVANDVARHPSRRGLLYIGTNNVFVTEALIQKNPHLAKSATRISVVGDLSGIQSLRDFNINAVSVSRDLATTFQFVILLSDLHAYAICAILKKEDQWEGFHTSNDSLVEDLIFKLRDEYGLQEQI